MGLERFGALTPLPEGPSSIPSNHRVTPIAPDASSAESADSYSVLKGKKVGLERHRGPRTLYPRRGGHLELVGSL